MKKEFIKVNKTIFDYKRYIEEVLWLKHDVKQRIIDMLNKDFMLLKGFEEDYDKLFLSFYNKKLDLNIEVECKKQNTELFV